MDERERRMQAVQARLQRVSTTQDFSPVLEKAALAEVRELTLTLTDDPDSLPAMHLLGWLHWYRFQALPEEHDQQDLQNAVTLFTWCFANGMGELPSSLLPLLADRAEPDAEHLLDVVQRSDDQELLSAAVDLWRRILAATPAGHPDRTRRVSILGAALTARFHRTGAESDLDNAIQALQEAEQATPADHPERAAILSLLAATLTARLQRTGAEADLDNAIQAGQQAVQAIPADHPDRAAALSNLGTALTARFHRTGAEADLDTAIQALQEAEQATPADHPDRAAILSILRGALAARFQRTGAEADFDTIIKALQQEVQATPANDPQRAEILSMLGAALTVRFQRAGAEADLDNAVQAGQLAVQATSAGDPYRAAALFSLGAALTAQFQSGAEADLDTAIQALQEAVQATPADDPYRAAALSGLGTALTARFHRSGAEADLHTAIQAGQLAMQAIPADHPYRVTALSSLGAALTARFQRTGAEADLDNAIQAHQEAEQATPADDWQRAAILGNLAAALTVRFHRSGAESDLDNAIQARQQAVQATPADHPERGTALSNLGGALRTRFERTRTQADLDNAIQALQQAVAAAPAGHRHRPGILSNLGTALTTRFQRTGAEADLDNAIQAHQQAVQATPADTPYRAGRLTSLGGALTARFQRSGAEADLDNAVQALQQAVQATPADHPDRSIYLSNLGGVLRTRFERTGAVRDRDTAFRMYSEAASVDVAPASARIGAGRAGASLVAVTDPGRAAGLLEAAVLLLPEVAPRLLERGDQQHAIGRFAGLAADAAALALSDPAVPELQRPARALRLLEAARGILLSQALSTRGDLSQLRERQPELAARFTELRDWLDRPPAAGPELGNLPGDETADAPQHAIRDRRQAAAELARLLARIRSLEGLATFGLPPSAGQLEGQGQQGPVVVLNVSDYRSDAIVLTSGGITSLPLPGLDQDTVIRQVIAFHKALDAIAASGSPLAGVRAQEAIRQVLAWLWDNAAGPILDALGYRDQPPAEKPWPRLWWVPGGLLALLPVHAAGHHTGPPDPGHRAVMDRVISSYAPTIGALAHARAPRPTTPPGTTTRSLIVAMPTTPDLPGGAELAYVPAEAALLRARLPNPTVLSEPPAASDATSGQLPTKATVLEHLPGSAIAHFACHGSNDPADPSQSRLLLHDHRTDPLTVAALAPLALDDAQLAYLSACSTARVSDPDLMDEAIHLATAFQLAGFPHVIGTLWEINDAIAVEIADTFYTALLNLDGILDPDHAAYALHQATRAQRDRWPAAPYLWASHIHAGT